MHESLHSVGQFCISQHTLYGLSRAFSQKRWSSICLSKAMGILLQPCSKLCIVFTETHNNLASSFWVLPILCLIADSCVLSNENTSLLANMIPHCGMSQNSLQSYTQAHYWLLCENGSFLCPSIKCSIAMAGCLYTIRGPEYLITALIFFLMSILKQ